MIRQPNGQIGNTLPPLKGWEKAAFPVFVGVAIPLMLVIGVPYVIVAHVSRD